MNLLAESDANCLLVTGGTIINSHIGSPGQVANAPNCDENLDADNFFQGDKTMDSISTITTEHTTEPHATPQDMPHKPSTEGLSEYERWEIAFNTLKQMLSENDGVVSLRTLRPAMEQQGVTNAKEMNSKLKIFNFDDPPPGIPRPHFRFYHRGRSFYSEDAFRAAEAETNAAAEAAELAAEEPDEEEVEYEEVTTRRRNRQEEARLVKYVEEALENLYASDYGPDVRVGYDVHDERPGNEYENMDALAVHWRSDEVVETIGVEVKLAFCASAVQQANNYCRFAHRVWIAVPCRSDEPGVELRELDPNLFEYVVEQGIGILACRRRQGGSYEVWPIHWPSMNRRDSIAEREFIERYRSVFEEAGVVKPREQEWKPPQFAS